MCMCVVVGGDTVDSGTFWEICEAHAKLETERSVFSETSHGFVVNVLPEVNTDSIGHGKLTLTSNTTSSEQALVFYNQCEFATLMSCLKFTLTALGQNTTRKRLWIDNIAHCRANT